MMDKRSLKGWGFLYQTARKRRVQTLFKRLAITKSKRLRNLFINEIYKKFLPEPPLFFKVSNPLSYWINCFKRLEFIIRNDLWKKRV